MIFNTIKGTNYIIQTIHNLINTHNSIRCRTVHKILEIILITPLWNVSIKNVTK